MIDFLWMFSANEYELILALLPLSCAPSKPDLMVPCVCVHHKICIKRSPKFFMEEEI